MSLSKKLSIVAAVVSGIILINLFHEISSDRVGYFGNHQERQALDPAESGEEWMRRLKLDLENNHLNSSILVNLYAELPPKSEWPQLTKSIDELAADVGKIEKWMGDNSYGNQPEIMSRKLRIFSRLLKDENANVESDIRELIEASDSYQFTALLMASKDRQASLDWIEKRRSNSTSTSSFSRSHVSRMESGKTYWEEALAENRVDEGIALLKEEISKTTSLSHLAGHWDKLLRIGLLTDRASLATEATENLKKNLILHVQSDEWNSSYHYRSLFDLNLRKNEWESILNTLDEVYAAQKKRKHTLEVGDFGYLDEANALYLAGLHELGRVDEFLSGLKAAQEVCRENPENFFKMLGFQTNGRKTLGVTYIGCLKESGELDNAKAYAMHLLARNQGEDVHYETLIDLDPVLAGSFVESVRKYDPFEERPLIWKAEMARRAGNLDLALKTIEEAIALDPSDGDHGKDSRMFCYEVLARVHKDAGRQEKADFFRSVVDSIRQGEAADDYLHAGLIKEATERYQKALGQFEDAYCLQSRLAMTFARNGQFEKSVKHFKKAFELMPVSFGPRESHCFGCEGLFSDQRIIDIAKPLLQEFEKSNPDNPRAPYLLGLVLEKNNEEAQAVVAFRRAFEIDPNYYNAATKLLELLGNDEANYEKIEELRKKIFPIAPYSSKPKYLHDFANLHSHWDLSESFKSPLVLPPIPFLVVANRSKNQYEPHDGNAMRFHSFGDLKSLEGWKGSDLRRMNEFLISLDYIR